MTSVFKIPWHHPRYPALLKEIRNAPRALYVRGCVDRLDQAGFAVVGTRSPTPYGAAVARVFTRALVEEGWTIVSGLAYGIDAEAHEVAVGESGSTIAVLGSGLDQVHPRGHRDLAESIVKAGGLLVSEYPPDVEPRAHHFPARNRLISGLTRGTLVVEAPERSGALITARFAFEQNRHVFTVPGDLSRETFRGNHALVARDMARLVSSPEELLFHLGPLGAPRLKAWPLKGAPP